ncbi:DUF1684 domain-containing protein [Brevibacterium linens]|uniref:DUF1684 domain-containing protein n=1 Tax=Brevibacterium linens ATCC 9172 TaxID=1255617 RepID=A0A2H1J888_BRELN|nr:DUF1684 domain-containing protein [Brevibacterium linens]SMX83402.1 Protein of unknown function (DUF1684) [Brevibacterium linens ATCC 9172]
MNQFVTEWNTWRDSRNSALAKPFGWLSVVGLHWLDDESTWADAPGTFTVDDGWVTVSLDPGIKAGPAAETFDLLSTVGDGPDGSDPAGSGAGSGTGPGNGAGSGVNGAGANGAATNGAAATNSGPTRATSPTVPSDTSTLPRVTDQTGAAGAGADSAAGADGSAGAEAGASAGSQATGGHDAVPARPQVRVEENGFSAKIPTGGSLNWFTVGNVLYELIDRAGRLGVRVRNSKSPLLGKFFEVPVFDPDPDFVFLARFTRFDPFRTYTIETAQEDLQLQTQAAGIVTFDTQHGEVNLLATGCPKTGLQLDFHDSTNGSTTSAWRTIDLGVPNQDGSLVVDFNRAVNYPFAFTSFATCPAPIEGNVVPFDVTAGERRPPFFYSEAGINVPFLFYVWWDEDSAEVTRPWYSRFGLDITILNPNHDDGRISLVGFDGVAMSGGDLSPLGRKARSRLIDVATEALTSRIPVIGIGAYSAFVIQAQRELRSQQGYVDGIETEYSAPEDRLLIVMNNELDPKQAGFDIVHTDASGLLYVEMPFDIPLESDRTEVEDFQAAMESGASISSWQEFDYRMVALIRHHR